MVIAHAGTVELNHNVSAPRAGRTVHTVFADGAVATTDLAAALARGAVLVEPVGTGINGARHSIAAICPGVVGDQPGSGAHAIGVTSVVGLQMEDRARRCIR